MTLERETKLQAPPSYRVPDLTLDGHLVTERPAQRLVTTYVDTPDLRIARWGCSLRHRQGEGWTVKLPPSEEGSMLVRPEHGFDGEDPRKLPVAASDLLRAYVRGGELAPVARLRTVRRTLEVADELGRPVAVVTDDEVSVMDGRRVASRFRELEVELADAVPREAADGLVARLREAGAGPVENVPKLLRALGPRASEPPDVVVPEIDDDASVVEVVRRALAASVVRLLRHDAGVRLGEDAEDVHQARVATRRLRSDLRTFRDVLEPSWSGPLRDELRWLGRQLGAVRDAEVLRDRFRGREPRLADGDRPAVEELLTGIDGRRDEARGHLLGAMREPRYATLLDALVEAARAPAVLEEVGTGPARATLGVVLDAPWKHLRTAVRHIEDGSPDEVLHAARIRTKRVRYAAEAVAPAFDKRAFGKRAKAFADAASDLQDVLGEHQDSVVAAAWLRDAAEASPSHAFVAGQLASMEAEAARAARQTWPKAWKALSRKRLRFWT